MMSLQDWFKKRAEKQAAAQLDADGMNRVDDAQYKKLWHQCFNCGTNLLKTELKANASVCPHCGYHHRISAKERIHQLTQGCFIEFDVALHPADPLTFTDTEPYLKRQEEAKRKTKLNDALVGGLGLCGQEPLAMAVMDFNYMGGSMGSVVGEKITRMAERALQWQVPFLVVTASGGARMQEGMFSLMQMVKTSAVLAQLHESGLLYLTLLTEPTFGGVTASYGTLGDVIIAEEGARIGFAGRRVIEQTIRQKLPANFQTAGYLQTYGQVDMVLKRQDIQSMIEQLCRLHRISRNLHPTEEALALLAPFQIAKPDDVPLPVA